jgi:hypothetical protein
MQKFAVWPQNAWGVRQWKEEDLARDRFGSIGESMTSSLVF